MRVKPEDLPRRPPNLCAGCSHRPLFYALKKLGAFVFGDIGCYTLAFLRLSRHPHYGLHGRRRGGAYGAGRPWARKGWGRSAQSSATPPFSIPVSHRSWTPSTIRATPPPSILDNRITGMTGHQEHPGRALRYVSEPTNMVDYAADRKAVGVKSIRNIDPYNIKETMEVLKEEMAKNEPSLILWKDSPCMLLRRAKPLEKFKIPVYVTNMDKCRGCKMCLEINCPAISWKEGAGETKDGHKRKGTIVINPDQCVGCEVCVQICKYDAIEPGTK